MGAYRLETYRVSLIWETENCTATATVGGVLLSRMQAIILGLALRSDIPGTAALLVENEQTGGLFFRDTLSSVSSLFE